MRSDYFLPMNSILLVKTRLVKFERNENIEWQDGIVRGTRVSSAAAPNKKRDFA